MLVWLIRDEIVSEYKRVLARLGVRRSLMGKSSICYERKLNSWLSQDCLISPPILEMIRSVPTLKLAEPIL
jgi:hypothetical protein